MLPPLTSDSTNGGFSESGNEIKTRSANNSTSNSSSGAESTENRESELKTTGGEELDERTEAKGEDKTEGETNDEKKGDEKGNRDNRENDNSENTDKTDKTEKERRIKHIEFKKKYKRKLMGGKKSCTIRKRCYVSEGDEVLVHCGGKIIGKARITEVEERRVDELGDDIAREEGFKSRKELVNEIRKIYGDLDKVYVIRFKFDPFRRAINPEELYYSGDLKEIAERALRELKLSEEERRILELFLECGSVKKAAMRLGGIWERKKVREVLRTCSRRLGEVAKEEPQPS